MVEVTRPSWISFVETVISEEMLRNLPSTKEEIVNPSKMRHMEKKKKWYKCCGSCGRNKKQDKVGDKSRKKGLFGKK